MIKLGQLLRINLAMLKQERILRSNVGLPGKGTNILGAEWISEHALDLFKSLARRFREGKEDVDEHGRVEDTKDDIRFPLDIFESRRHEIAEGKIEDPIRRRGERDGFTSYAQRVELRRVDPADGAPRRSVASDEEVGTCDKSLRWGTRDGPGGFRRVVHACGAGIMAVGFEKPGVGKHEDHHT